MQPFTAEEGAALPRLYGTARIGGTVIWATRFQETRQRERRGKGGPKVTTYHYSANAAFALCEGPVAGIRRVWADGRELDLTQVELRFYAGSEDQLPDPLIKAKQGAGGAPAYRGTAYAVIDHFPLEEFGNRLPQFQFEVMRPLGRLEARIKAVALIPGSTEYGLATTLVTRQRAPGETEAVNRHSLRAASDLAASLDELQALCPALEHVGLVVTWFGDDLRAGHCRIRPGVTSRDGSPFSMPWLAGNATRADAHLVSQHSGSAAYGGSPADIAILEAIAEIRRRGLKVTLYPFIMMDVPHANTLPDPHGGMGQPPYPWRGRITCDPAPAAAGSADRTAAARAQVGAFCGQARADDFLAVGGAVTFTGDSADWGYRRFVLHMAHLARLAGGVDAFLIGSELRGLTTLRDETDAFPFVEVLCSLAAEVRTILDSTTKITYGADWSEYFGHQPADGSGDVFFHLDPLWAHPAIDAVGIDNYMPLSDWRDGDHAGGNPDGFAAPYGTADLRGQIAAGEGFDWFYASAVDRDARRRTPITDAAYGKPWVFRYKDLVSWWSRPHHDRPGGVEKAAPTAWVPQSKPIWFTELGCPAVDKGPNQPNVFPDPKSSESARPHYSNGGRSDLAQRRFLEAHLGRWTPDAEGFSDGLNPLSPLYGGRMVDASRLYLWAWDARPFPAFPVEGAVWSDGGNWLLGHWLNGRLGKAALSDVLAAILAEHGLEDSDAGGAEGSLHGYVIARPGDARAAIEPLTDLYGLAVQEEEGRLFLATEGRQAEPPVVLEEFVAEEWEPILVHTREAIQDYPSAFSLGFRDPLIDYQAATAHVVGADASGNGETGFDLPLCLEAGEAEMVAAEWLRRRQTGRTGLVLAVPAQERRPRVGGLIRLGNGPEEDDFIVEAIEEGTVRRLSARRLVRLAPQAERASLPLLRPARAVQAGAPLAIFLDLPMGPAGGKPEDQFRIAVYARPWAAQAVFASGDLDGFAERATVLRPATVGILAEPATAGRSGLLDHAHVIRIELFAGELESVSLLRLLNGANAAAIRSNDGGWEVFQFQNATETAANRWELSGLLRGQLGTEDAMRAGAQAGAQFVLLDDAVIPAGLRQGEAGLEINWRIGPASKPLDTQHFAAHAASGGLRARLPLSPVHLRATGGPTGDVTFSWIRRGRIDADSWQGSEIPLDEVSEAYHAGIAPAGGAPLRSVHLTTPAWTYAAVHAASDFPVRPADVDLIVRQVSPSAGPGLPATLRVRLD
jgi:hypothetical protein